MTGDLLSFDRVCEAIQRRTTWGLSPLSSRIMELAEEAGIKSAMTINGVAHYDSDSVERLKAIVKESRNELPPPQATRRRFGSRPVSTEQPRSVATKLAPAGIAASVKPSESQTKVLPADSSPQPQNAIASLPADVLSSQAARREPAPTATTNKPAVADDGSISPERRKELLALSGLGRCILATPVTT